ncbi:hypothetical protein ACFUJ0_06185 [Streptomyces sp. NPDC057242]|uniref:hypothetical protein n=1 Tax=unclassified Streptomyces TaxID=2593676 RepID=UPI003635F4E5
MSIPTPADVFHRHARPLLAPEPHNPATDPPFRLLWEEGIRGARLLPNTKFVALTLATCSAWDTGRIPADAQPHLGGLIGLTRVDVALIVISLKILEQRGWIRRANRRQGWNEADVELAIPGPIMRRLLKKARTART